MEEFSSRQRCWCVPRKSASVSFREKVQMVIPRKSASCQAVESNGNLEWVVPRKSANDECPFREKVQG